MIVVDTSVLVDLLLLRPNASLIDARLFDGRNTLHAPHLIDIEIAQVIRRFARVGALEAERGREVLTDFADLPLNRHTHELLLRRVWELRHHLTAYDATYVALAELLGATLLTKDSRIARAPGLRAAVEVIE